MTSGVGEMTAPTTNDMNNTMRCFFRRKAELMKPSFAKMIMTSGTSKIAPNGKTNAITKSKYLSIDKSGWISPPPKFIKKPMAAGMTKKKEKASPAKKSSTEDGTTRATTVRSRMVSAGSTKRQIS